MKLDFMPSELNVEKCFYETVKKAYQILAAVAHIAVE